jgi:hypothetical protein
MLCALAAALSLQLAPKSRPPAVVSIEHVLTGIFQSDGEAVNFSAHAAWSVAMPLSGQAMFGRPGLWTFGGGWIAYTLVNEFTLHGPESSHERTLNLVSRLAPCGVILLFDLVRNGFAEVSIPSSFDGGSPPPPPEEPRYDMPRVEDEPLPSSQPTVFEDALTTEIEQGAGF